MTTKIQAAFALSTLLVCAIASAGCDSNPIVPEPLPTAIPPSAAEETGVVTTLAGSPSDATFDSPMGVALDAAGNVYVADTNNQVIRKITPQGEVSTFAGAGGEFGQPQSVAVDHAGNVYVADSGYNRIDKVTPAGSVSILAGSADEIGGFDNGTGESASFNYPYGLALDTAGNVYVADTGNHAIRRITPAGVTTTLAGNGSCGATDSEGSGASFCDPRGVALDSAGNIYVADTANDLVRKVTPSGVVTTLAGTAGSELGSVDGTGSGASFDGPWGIAVNSAGELFVVDQNDDYIRKVTQAGVVTTVAGDGNQGFSDGTGAAAEFCLPTGLAADTSGHLYVADTGNNSIRVIHP